MSRGTYERASNLPYTEAIRVPSLGACWEWALYRENSGSKQYGQLRYEGRTQYAHRVAYSLLVEPIPKGQCVLHRCDNPPCIRPEHLFLGTKTQNHQDMWAKGRGVAPSHKGEECYQHKLTTEQVIFIKTSLAQGKSCAELGRQFGITTQGIHNIKANKTWRHVNP